PPGAGKNSPAGGRTRGIRTWRGRPYPREVGFGGATAMSAPRTRTQRLVAGIALLMVCASFTGARSGRGSPAADDEHRWHKGPVDGTAVLGPSTATPLSPLLPPRHRLHRSSTNMNRRP